MNTQRNAMPGLLTPPEVSAWLGVPVATLYAQRYRGDRPGSLGIRVGRHLRFDRADIEAWLDARRQPVEPAIRHDRRTN